MTPSNTSRRAGLLILFLLLISAFIFFSFAQTRAASQANDPLWQDISETDAMRQTPRRIVPDTYRLVRLNPTVLQDILGQAPAEFSGLQGIELTLPLPDGNNGRFLIYNSPMMEPELAAKFPQFQTYNGIGLDDPTATVRLGWTHMGFHATIRAVGQSPVYIDPYAFGDTLNYLSYRKNDYNTSDANRAVPPDQVEIDPLMQAKIESLVASGEARLTGEELRIYRLAVGTTGEYTQFHGGSVADGLAAVVVAMNRVNGLYERDVAIRMVLVANNDQVIFTNPNTDPYTNNSGGTMLGQNQTTLDNIIGNANYDIGHVFSTGGGGIAGLGVPCVTGSKARGVTGLPSPINDPFYVDYVAHELGHQWGATHTFNGNAGSCAGGNRTASTAYEPGSGTTIMAYAGICGAQNIQNNSDDHFHGASYDQIVAYSTLGSGNSCAQIQATGNTPPTADAGQNYTVPADTPFMLTGSGADADPDDVLSYNWEQFDLGPAGTLNNPDLPPHFRAFPSKAEPVRIFPQISDILSNISTLGEMLPGATDTLTFRLNVRDNRLNGGGVDFDTMNLDVTDTAGPFIVTDPTEATSWTATTTAAVNWDVAGTDAAPVSCSQVDIALSTDGGATFEETLATAVANDGSELVTVPNVTTSQARVRIMCRDNVFFNISGNNDFEITNPTDPTFTLNADPATQNVCVPANGVIGIDTQAVLGFNETINLTTTGNPAGTTAVFGQASLTPGESTTLTISDTNSATTGDYTITITGTATTVTRTATAQISLLPGTLSAPALTQPLDGATNVGFLPTFTWNSVDNATSYEFELATDNAFTNIVYSTITTDLEATPLAELASSTTYYWRVTASGVCGSAASTTYSFTTQLAPGACTPDQTTVIAFEDDFESGEGGWTHSGVQDSWTLSGANPFSGNFSWYAIDQDSESDQRLVSPAIDVPAGESVTLQFQNRQFFEAPDIDGCWDAGILEISTDNGASWNYIPNSLLLPDADPYDQLLWNNTPGNNPITSDYGQVAAWCDPGQGYRNAVVDLSDYQGQTVRFRWRLGTDSFVGAEGWYVDDVKVQACQASPFAVESEVTSAGTTAVNTTITHTVNLTNTGQITDTYDLTISGETWNTAVSPATVELGIGQMGTVSVAVTAPANSAGQTDTATLTATSQGDNSVSSVTSITTSAYDPAGLTLSAPITTSLAEAGVTVTYTVVLSNDSGVADDISLSMTGTATSTVTPSFASLASGASLTLTVHITMPTDALAGELYESRVTATPTDSRLDAPMTMLSTQVYDPAGLLVSAPVISTTAVPGSSVTYTVNVTNDTGLLDTFTLTVSDTLTSNITPTVITLAHGASTTATVQVSLPLDAPPETGYDSTVTVAPSNSLIKPQALILTTNTLPRFTLFMPMVVGP